MAKKTTKRTAARKRQRQHVKVARPKFKVGQIVKFKIDPIIKMQITKIYRNPKGHETRVLYEGKKFSKYGDIGTGKYAEEFLTK
jgi:ribosomal protein L21E